MDELEQGANEDVNAYATRTTNARVAAIKFMAIEKHSEREIKQFKVNFNTGWIKGLVRAGELTILNATAIKSCNPLPFK